MGLAKISEENLCRNMFVYWNTLYAEYFTANAKMYFMYRKCKHVFNVMPFVNNETELFIIHHSLEYSIS